MKKFILIFMGLLVLLIAVSVLVTLLLQDGVSLKEKVALVRIEGPIIDATNTVNEIKGYVDDSSIKAIVLRVDSPGGAVAPSQEIFSEVKKATGAKKVVVSMGSVAASGGYYVAIPADRILANPGTITGSIGVIMEIPNVEGLMNKIGIKTEVVKSGVHKDTGSIFREMSEQERTMLQRVINDVYEQFVSDVAESRSLDIEEVRKLSDGRIYTGRQALELGLIDQLGSLEDAIEVSAELSGIEGEPEVVTKEEKLSVLQLLRNKLSAELPELYPHIRLKYMLSP